MRGFTASVRWPLCRHAGFQQALRFRPEQFGLALCDPNSVYVYKACGLYRSASSSSKISSTVRSNSRAILNASGNEGSYFPFSIALTEFLEMPSSLARSACVHRRSARKTRMLFFIVISGACAHHRFAAHQTEWLMANTAHSKMKVNDTPNAKPIAAGDNPLLEDAAMLVITR